MSMSKNINSYSRHLSYITILRTILYIRYQRVFCGHTRTLNIGNVQCILIRKYKLVVCCRQNHTQYSEHVRLIILMCQVTRATACGGGHFLFGMVIDIPHLYSRNSYQYHHILLNENLLCDFIHKEVYSKQELHVISSANLAFDSK